MMEELKNFKKGGKIRKQKQKQKQKQMQKVVVNIDTTKKRTYQRRKQHKQEPKQEQPKIQFIPIPQPILQSRPEPIIIKQSLPQPLPQPITQTIVSPPQQPLPPQISHPIPIKKDGVLDQLIIEKLLSQIYKKEEFKNTFDELKEEKETKYKPNIEEIRDTKVNFNDFSNKIIPAETELEIKANNLINTQIETEGPNINVIGELNNLGDILNPSQVEEEIKDIEVKEETPLKNPKGAGRKAKEGQTPEQKIKAEKERLRYEKWKEENPEKYAEKIARQKEKRHSGVGSSSRSGNY